MVPFPYGSQVNADAMRWVMGRNFNPTGPNRYESGDVGFLSGLAGVGTAFSNWWDLNVYGYLEMQQGEGYVYDGCYGRDHWCYYDATSDDGVYVGSFGGPSTYNSERGYNNGTFLTFGYSYCYTYTRPYSYHTVVSYSSTGGYPPCAAMYVDILQLYGYNTVASNMFGYSSADQYCQRTTESTMRSSEVYLCRLILWYY